MKNYGFRFFGFFILSALFALPARAQEPSAIIISEINFAGSAASTADEWLELANTSANAVDVSEWVISGAATGGGALAIADGTIMQPKSTLLIANYARGNAKSTLAVDPALVTTAVALANSNLTLLLAMPDGTVIDSYVDAGTPDFGGTSPARSIERNLIDLSWQTATLSLGLTDTNQLGTPGSAIFPVTPIDEPAPADSSPLTPSINGGGDQTPDQSAEGEPATIETPVEPPPVAIPVVEAPVVEPPTPLPEPTVEAPTIVEPVPEVVIEVPPSFTPGDIVINEIFSDAGEGDEWVEFKNNLEETVSLDGWVIKDASGKTTVLAGSIPASGYSLVLNPSGNLNNSGDTITLFDPAGNSIDTITYGTDTVPLPDKTQSAAQDDHQAWHLASPSPGATNPQPVVEENLDTTYVPLSPNLTYDPQTDELHSPLDDSGATQGAVETTDPAEPTPVIPDVIHIVAVAEPVTDTTTPEASTSTTTSSLTTIEGTVVATPDTFGRQVAFLNGYELYFYHADWPELSLGAVVRISGTVSTVNGHERLKIASADDIIVLQDTSDVVPTDIVNGNLENLPHGSLVRVAGTVTGHQGNHLTIMTDAGTSVTITAHDKTNVSWSGLKSGRLVVTGILRVTDKGTEIVPRNMDDIVEEVVATTPTTPSTHPRPHHQAPWVGGGLLTGSAGALGTWFLRARRLALA